MVRYANDLISIFMNIYENMRNKKKRLEKIGTALPKGQLLTILDNKKILRNKS